MDWYKLGERVTATIEVQLPDSILLQILKGRCSLQKVTANPYDFALLHEINIVEKCGEDVPPHKEIPVILICRGNNQVGEMELSARMFSDGHSSFYFDRNFVA